MLPWKPTKTDLNCYDEDEEVYYEKFRTRNTDTLFSVKEEIMDKINRMIDGIKPLDERAMAEARIRQDNLTKPQGSLGQLESLSIQIAGIKGNSMPRIVHKVIFTLAGDHGIAREGVSAFPSEVTPQMVYNFLRGGAGINVLGRHVGARVVVADLGVAADLEQHPDLKDKKVARGTKNMAEGPAMSEKEAIRSIEAGMELVEEERARGIDILGTGIWELETQRHPAPSLLSSQAPMLPR